MVLIMDYIRDCLATNLKIRRAFMNLSQEELAELAGLSSGFIANMETGRSWPSSETLFKLSKALKVDHWNLLVDPKKNEIGYSKEEFLMLFDRMKTNFMRELPTTFSASRRLLNEENDKH
jgi:transcriptional regulator with XRE-family HTH domain